MAANDISQRSSLPLLTELNKEDDNDISAPYIQIPRFHGEDTLNISSIDVSLDGCRLIVAGFDLETYDTFIDLFRLNIDSGCKGNQLLIAPKPYFSKTFTPKRDSNWRFVCMLDDSVFATCCSCIIESYHTKGGRLVNQSKLASVACCMKTRNERIYVGLRQSSEEVFVFDLNLIQIKTISLLLNKDYPMDITVNNNKLFICTYNSGRALVYTSDGDTLHQYSQPNEKYVATSTTVSEENGLIYILVWGGCIGRRVLVYSLPENPPTWDQHSFSVGHLVASINVSRGSFRIGINDNLNRLFVVTKKTGKVYQCHTSDIFNFENLQTSLTTLIDTGSCEKLLSYFKVPADKADTIIKSENPPLSLLQHLRETVLVSTSNLAQLISACTDHGLSNAVEVLEIYQQVRYSSYQRPQLLEEVYALARENAVVAKLLRESEQKEGDLSRRLSEAQQGKQDLTHRLSAEDIQNQRLTYQAEVSDTERKRLAGSLDSVEEERKRLQGRLDRLSKTTQGEKRELVNTIELPEEEKNELTNRLKTTNAEKQLLEDRLLETEKEKKIISAEEKMPKRLVDEKQQQLDEIKSSLRAAKDELVKSHVEYAKESMALKEVLRQTRQSFNKTSADSVKRKRSFSEENQSPQELSLAVSFGRLMVDVAEDLSLDSALKLAYLFGLPPAESDMLRRISLIETPGLTLIIYLKKRNIINMYDVTNLQKGLTKLHMHKTNETLLLPYQNMIDKFQFEEHRSPKLLDWPEINVVTEVEAPIKNELEHQQDEERLMETMKRGLPRAKLDLQPLPEKKDPYIEHNINYEGGTISVMGIHLSIPGGALSSDHVIGVSLIHDPDIHLPGSARRGRMTPLIKLEPERLELNKSARLTIPHSAIIPEPDRHDVIIFTGKTGEGSLRKGEITWTEETSMKWKLEQESITLDINRLSYIFVNLVSPETEQKHIFRVVPLIDGILHTENDILITVCFCKDSDEEYRLVLKDHQSKLTLGDYATFQISRTVNESSGDVTRYVELAMSSQEDGYYLNKEESTQHVDIDHLCAASRVSHQFRLKRNEHVDTDMIDVKLKFSQEERKEKFLILRAKVKDIFLSPESQHLLCTDKSIDSSKYEDLKMTVSGLLNKDHCEKLAVFFELTPAERDKIEKDDKPGMALIRILDERELIMPDKMINLYEGLIASHLNKIARHVLEYIDASKKERAQESAIEQLFKDETHEAENFQREEDLQQKSNIKLLTGEGHEEIDVRRALKLSRGYLDLGRKILMLANEHKDKQREGRSLSLDPDITDTNTSMTMEDRLTNFLSAVYTG